MLNQAPQWGPQRTSAGASLAGTGTTFLGLQRCCDLDQSQVVQDDELRVFQDLLRVRHDGNLTYAMVT